MKLKIKKIVLNKCCMQKKKKQLKMYLQMLTMKYFILYVEINIEYVTVKKKMLYFQSDSNSLFSQNHLS